MNDAEMEKTVEDRVTTVEALAELVSEPTIFCGAITQEMETELRDRLGGRALIPQAVARASRAVCMGDIGIGRIANGRSGRPCNTAAVLPAPALDLEVDSAAGRVRSVLLI